MTGFEPRTSGIGSNCYTNWATTIAQLLESYSTQTSRSRFMTLASVLGLKPSDEAGIIIDRGPEIVFDTPKRANIYFNWSSQIFTSTDHRDRSGKKSILLMMKNDDESTPPENIFCSFT